MRKWIFTIGTLALAVTLDSAEAGKTHVNGYYRSDGTYVRPHYRSTGSSGGGSYSSPASTTFSSCDAARAAGYSNMTPGSAGYSSSLDRDGDGVACESGSGTSGSASVNSSSLYSGSSYSTTVPQRPTGAVAGVNYFAAEAIKNYVGSISQLESKKFTIGVATNKLTVTVGNIGAVLNGEYIKLNAAPVIYKNKLYLPAQTVYKLGCNLEMASPVLHATCPNYRSIITADVMSW